MCEDVDEADDGKLVELELWVRAPSSPVELEDEVELYKGVYDCECEVGVAVEEADEVVLEADVELLLGK